MLAGEQIALGWAGALLEGVGAVLADGLAGPSWARELWGAWALWTIPMAGAWAATLRWGPSSGARHAAAGAYMALGMACAWMAAGVEPRAVGAVGMLAAAACVGMASGAAASVASAGWATGVWGFWGQGAPREIAGAQAMDSLARIGPGHGRLAAKACAALLSFCAIALSCWLGFLTQVRESEEVALMGAVGGYPLHMLAPSARDPLPGPSAGLRPRGGLVPMSGSARP